MCEGQPETGWVAMTPSFQMRRTQENKGLVFWSGWSPQARTRGPFGARGIVGKLAKGHPEILSRHILQASFSHTAEKKQSSTIFQNTREWIRVDICLKGLLW